MSGASEQQAFEERQKYVSAFNDTMLKIWQEQITLLGVIDTGQLLASPKALPLRADGRFVEIGLSQAFLEYGLWQDYGTGKETPRGNSGDISCKRVQSGVHSNSAECSRNRFGENLGREKVRQRRRWFSRKYFASVMNIRDFFADNLGKEFQGIISDAFERY